MWNFFYQLCFLSSGRFISDFGSNLLDDIGARPKRVKTALPFKIGLRGLKNSNICLMMMSNTFREPKNPILVDIYWIKIELGKKRVKTALPFKIGLRGLKNSNICLIMMSNTFRKPKNSILVDIYWIEIELGQKGVKTPYLPK